jgi:hypothetical protein
MNVTLIMNHRMNVSFIRLNVSYRPMTLAELVGRLARTDQRQGTVKALLRCSTFIGRGIEGVLCEPYGVGTDGVEAAFGSHSDNWHIDPRFHFGGFAKRKRRYHVRGHSVETELVALDVLHHQARLIVAIGGQ